jgi:ribosome-binding protein aMBF1 (putative translation factor)
MGSMLNDQDWKTVTFNNPKNAVVKTGELFKKQELLGRFKDRGEQVKHQKLDSHEEVFETPKATLSFAQKMQKARLTSKLSQKDLAQKLNIQSNVINSYENGKAIQDKQLESKIKKLLNFK